MTTNSREERTALKQEAEENLSQAYRVLGDAADCLRGLGYTETIEEIGKAKDNINNAKNKMTRTR